MFIATNQYFYTVLLAFILLVIQYQIGIESYQIQELCIWLNDIGLS